MNAPHRALSGFAPGNIIPGDQIEILPASHAATATAPPASKTIVAHQHLHTQPSITLIKEGDSVRVIEITCTCGEVIRLQCEY